MLRENFKKKKKDFFAVVLLAAFLLLPFFYTSHLKEETFNRFAGPGDNLWRILSHDALQFTRNWYVRGPWQSGLVPEFGNVTIETIEDVNAFDGYFSYTGFFVLIPWILAKLTGQFPDLSLLMKLSLFTHYLFSFLLSFALFLLLREKRMPLLPRFFFSLIPGALCFFVPSAFHFFQNAWWSDVLVLPFLVGLVILDSLYDVYGDRKWFRIFFLFFVFLGALSDWIFSFFVAVLILQRLTDPKNRKFWPELVVPSISVFFFQLFQVLFQADTDKFYGKILLRTGVSGETRSLQEGVSSWLRTVKFEFGQIGLYLYFFSLVILPVIVVLFFKRFSFSQERRKIIELSALILIPVHLHSFVLHQHYFDHTYESLKFLIPFCFLVFGMWPSFLWLRQRIFWGKLAVVVVTILFVAGYLYSIREVLWEPRTYLSASQEAQDLCGNVANSPWEHIFVSPDFATMSLVRLEDEKNPKVDHWMFRLCYKHIYYAEEPGLISGMGRPRSWLRLVEKKNAQIWLIVKGVPDPKWIPWLLPETMKDWGAFRAFRLKKEVLEI